MKNMKYKWLLICFLISPLYLASASKTEKCSIRTAVIFNTLCAKCHEGECSGRLSFNTGSKVTSNHIKHYAGDITISDEKIKEFFVLLNHMKTECIIWMPNDVGWNRENLLLFALPSGKGYFIPFGFLKKGKYRLEIKIKEDIRFRIEVLSDKFEHFLDVSVLSNTEKELIQFKLDQSANIFLRIQSRETLHILDLNIKKDK